jgi:hypothetical protein
MASCQAEEAVRVHPVRRTHLEGIVVFLPRGVPHSFVAGPDGPARTLLINAGAGFADVVVELGTHAERLELPGGSVPTPEPARISAVSVEHGIEQVLPPGS